MFVTDGWDGIDGQERIAGSATRVIPPISKERERSARRSMPFVRTFAHGFSHLSLSSLLLATSSHNLKRHVELRCPTRDRHRHHPLPIRAEHAARPTPDRHPHLRTHVHGREPRLRAGHQAGTRWVVCLTLHSKSMLSGRGSWDQRVVSDFAEPERVDDRTILGIVVRLAGYVDESRDQS